jgi:hypothetical protein
MTVAHERSSISASSNAYEKKTAVRPFIPKSVYSAITAGVVAFASVTAVPSVPRSAELPPAADAKSQPSDSQAAPTTPTLSDAQIEALLKEIGAWHDSRTEAGLTPETQSPPLHPTTTFSDAQRKELIREMGTWYDSRTEGAAGPETTPSPSQPTTASSDAQRKELIREIGSWYDSRTEAAPTPETKPSRPLRAASRRYWRHYSRTATADRGEATRLMVDELRQSGVAVDTASGSGHPK